MYNHYFGFSEAPFSIAPDPRYLYLSEQHREALAHLVYGIGDQGGFVVLTGEVGTGKTTVCRCLLQQVPEHVDVAVVVNPKLSTDELLLTICEELGVELPEEPASGKQLIDALNYFLLRTHARGRNAILIIDEAQNLAPDVLEQLRLLTNLETNERKLLQLILLGQPELNAMLAQPHLRQLAQRITARYHLRPLTLPEVERYIVHRLSVAGGRGNLFSPSSVRLIARYSKGIPRLVNVLCDRALLGAYATGSATIDAPLLRRAAAEVLPRRRFSKRVWPGASAPGQNQAESEGRRLGGHYRVALAGLLVVMLVALLVLTLRWQAPAPEPERPSASTITTEAGWVQSLAQASATETDALTALYRLWDNPLPASGACRQDGQPLACASLSDIDRRALDRAGSPAMLVLSHTSWPGPRHVVLERLRGDRAHIHFGNREWQVSWQQLARYWHGEARVLLPAPIATLPLRTGDSGPLVSWVDTQLYRHYQGDAVRWERTADDYSDRLERSAGKAEWLNSHFLALQPAASTVDYGPELETVVKRFQQEQGLIADGIVRIDTVLALARGLPGPPLGTARDARKDSSEDHSSEDHSPEKHGSDDRDPEAPGAARGAGPAGRANVHVTAGPMPGREG